MSYQPMMHLADPLLTKVVTDSRWAPIGLPLVGTTPAFAGSKAWATAPLPH